MVGGSDDKVSRHIMSLINDSFRESGSDDKVSRHIMSLINDSFR